MLVALVSVVVTLAAVAPACGRSDSAAPGLGSDPDPTAATIAGPPTSTPVSVSTAASPTPVSTGASPTPVPTATAVATSTPAPTPTAAPTLTPAPTPTAVATSGPQSTPTSTSAPSRPVTVGCAITPTGPVAVRAPLVFQATASPATVPVQFSFAHGDGTIDPASRSDAYYAAPGQYQVTLAWVSGPDRGVVDCGTVTVLNGDGCWIGLGPADGLGWWCDDYFCEVLVGLHDGNAPNRTRHRCPTEPIWGCYTGMDGMRHCIDPGPTPGPTPGNCLVAPGPADELGWWCSDRWCDPHDPFPGCPPYPIFGCHPTPDGTICIDPGPPVDAMTCTVSDQSITVGEVITLRAHWSGPEVPIDVVFNHGDGTRDPRWVAQAHYLVPGTYTVTLEWTMFGEASIEHCGTVTVT